MKFILSRLKQFGRDEGGAFAVIFGVIAVVLIATGGSAVDFVNIQQGRKTTQISLDSTVLALQPEIYKNNKTWIKNRAQKLVGEAVAGTDVTMVIDKVEIDKDAGRLMISAQISRPTLFVRLVGVNEMKATLVSEATRAKNRLEVAMVLDNSGSMQSYGRMTALKTAANLAVDILMGGEDEPDKVFIGLVPFTMNVNVGSDKKTASWMDTLGRSSANWDNFDDDDDEDTGHDTTDLSDRFSRFALYDQLSNVSWQGCVESRPYPLDTNDTTPVPAIGDTYFVPMFNPDGPDSGASTTADYLNDYGGSCPATGNPGECTFQSWPGTKKKKGSRAPGQYSWWNPDSGSSTQGTNACNCDGQTITSSTSWNHKKKGKITQVKCDIGGVSLSPRERQERLCKYDGASASPSSGSNSPNGTCIDREILPLTNKKSTLKSNIDAMVASGGTNIHMGTIWGWRVLSPSAPYEEGVSYDEGASKVMIVMTDGQNYASQWGSFNGAYYYPAYSWPYNKRLGDVGWSNSAIISEMDKRTKEACENAKSNPSKIEIYTIGLGISKSSSSGKMLDACATDSAHAFFPSSSSDLIDTFETIADQLSDLRLSK